MSGRTPITVPLIEKAAVNTKPPPQEPELPKSRGLHILSSFTQSLSRGSLSRSTNRTRDAGGSSSTNPTPAPKTSRLSLPRFGRKSLEPMLEKKTEDQTPEKQEIPPPSPLPASLPVPDNPRFVVRAMPPQYWTGRFLALHDQFHNEVLEPRNLNTIIEAQVAQFSFCGDNNPAPETAGALNNPSTSVYAPNRIPRLSLGNYNPPKNLQHSSNLVARHPSRIPQSQTSNAVLESPQKTSNQNAPSPMSSRLSGPRSQPPSRLPSYDQSTASVVPAPLRLPLRQEPPETRTQKAPKAKKNDPAQDMRRAFLKAASEALIDDDSRCRRVIVNLEGLCMTEEALRSLYDWQEDFARRTKREGLLPPGASIRDPRQSRKTGSGLVGRLGGFLGRKSLSMGVGVGHESRVDLVSARGSILKVPQKKTDEILTTNVAGRNATGAAKPPMLVIV